MFVVVLLFVIVVLMWVAGFALMIAVTVYDYIRERGSYISSRFDLESGSIRQPVLFVF
jgi:hypothetical protein